MYCINHFVYIDILPNRIYSFQEDSHHHYLHSHTYYITSILIPASLNMPITLEYPNGIAPSHI